MGFNGLVLYFEASSYDGVGVRVNKDNFVYLVGLMGVF